VLAQAKSRLGDAGPADLGRRLEEAATQVELAAELFDIRVTPAIGEGKLDYQGMAAAYAHAFARAGLVVTDDAQAVADRIHASELRAELVMALDHWAYLEDALKHGPLRARLLDLARRADPDPEWGDRFRDPHVWDDPAALRQVAMEAQKRLTGAGAEKGPPLPLLALLAKKLGQKDDQAEPLLRAAQRLHPEDFWLCYSLGETLRERKPAEALGFYRAALAIRPHVAAVYSEVGWALARQGHADAALAEGRRALQLDPNLAPALLVVGWCMQTKGQLEDAIAQYRRVIHVYPDFEWTRHQLAVCLQETGRLDEAVAEFRHAIALNPLQASTHHLLGRCLEKLGRLEEAMTAHRRAIELDPDGARPHYQLAWCLQATGACDAALAEFRRAAELDPKAWQPLCQLGLALRARGRIEEAYAEITKAAQADAPPADVYLAMAETLLPLGRFTEARTAAKRGLGQCPAHDPQRPRLQQLFEQSERLIDLDAQLPAHLQGKLPAGDGAAQLDRARLCAANGRPFAAARLYAALFAAQPARADDLGSHHRYLAACAAARAAASQSTAEIWLGEPERAELRRQALNWLRADLALRTELLKAGKQARWSLTLWQTEAALAGVRDTAGLDRLDAAERKEWQRLWTDVAELLAADPREVAIAHAKRREWAQAADACARAAKLYAAEDGNLWFEFAAALLLSGDRDGYARACAHMVLRRGKAPNLRAYHVARARTLAPAPAADVARVEELAHKELADWPDAFWSLTAQGALHVRAGRFAEAVPLLERSLRADARYGRAVLNWLWLAIAHERLGNGAEARRQLARAQAWLDELGGEMQGRTSEDWGLDLHNWLEAHILRGEAEALLAPAPDAPK
jgi:tetratricopeptide (TPR) repeat protein